MVILLNELTRSWCNVVKFFPIILLLSISACSSINRDSAPTRFPDVSDVEDAEPSVEPSSKRGNPSSYVVNGIRYFPRKERLGFSQTGIASWYGTKFHGRQTSSGERYDMYKMTAAHKTLPLPTYVKVTNLENDKTIMVRVNDRGPFVEDRIIDLSYVAAIKLGITKAGTARVRINAWSPVINVNNNPSSNLNENVIGQLDHIDSQPISTQRFSHERRSNNSFVTPSNSSQYYLQLGSFANEKNAKNLESKLLAITEEPVKITVASTSMGKMYRVQLGPYEKKEKLMAIEKIFRQLGYTELTRMIINSTP